MLRLHLAEVTVVVMAINVPWEKWIFYMPNSRPFEFFRFKDGLDTNVHAKCVLLDSSTKAGSIGVTDLINISLPKELIFY